MTTLQTALLCIVVLAIGIAIGIAVGLRVKTRRMKDLFAEMQDLLQKLKDTNNQTLINCSKIYADGASTEGQFTDIDEYFMSMWMY